MGSHSIRTPLMLKIKRLRSRNPAVRAFHVLDEKGDAVGVITEELAYEGKPGCNDWRINKLLGYESLLRLHDLTEEEMLAHVEALMAAEPQMFEGERRYFFVQVITAFGKILNVSTHEDERMLSGVHKDLVYYPHVVGLNFSDVTEFSKKWLMRDGDWPLEFRIVDESTRLIEKKYRLDDTASIY